MSIEDQIEAAWKKYRPEALSTNSMALSHDVFTAGYLAALRSLFVEVNPEDLSEGGIYHARWADQPIREVYYDGESLCYWEAGGIGPNGETEYVDKSISPDECEIREFILPSPSDLFTEIKFN